MMSNKVYVDNVTLVPINIAVRLKKLGWNEQSPAIVRIKTGQIYKPVKPIDCSLGESYTYIPSISQVIRWLEKKDIIFDYSYSRLLKQYTSAALLLLSDRTRLIDGEWDNWEDLMINLIIESINYLENNVNGEKS